ncbi:PaaI family thioesterase [Glycomyces sp. NRRL B-16210]|uniref:PaaI family thioesterase n=1 Tax=Glycomyces sp. NRRL B-16210 TaxID=1463821 RepID=UPI0004BFDA01|nr:hotdog fold thioesterase [Glycomyces sp. NRRL B-16210]
MTVFPPEVLERFADAGMDLEKLFSAGELGQRMGIEILEAAPERLTARMAVEGNRQPYGLLHGGASGVLVETLGSIGSMLHAGPGRIAVGVDLNATHHRAVREGSVTAEATPIHRGRSTATYEVIVSDEEGRRVCTGRLTCMIRDEPTR